MKYNFFCSFWEATKNDNGRLGLIETMKRLFTSFLKTEEMQLFVLEDDFKILTDDYPEIINECIKQLPDDFDLFYAGCNLYGHCSRFSENLLKADGMYSSHAIIYSRKAIEKLLPHLDAAETYDVTLVNTIQKDGNSYCSFPLLISQQTGMSDIMNKVVNYEVFLEKRFTEKTKHLSAGQ